MGYIKKLLHLSKERFFICKFDFLAINEMNVPFESATVIYHGKAHGKWTEVLFLKAVQKE